MVHTASQSNYVIGQLKASTSDPVSPAVKLDDYLLFPVCADKVSSNYLGHWVLIVTTADSCDLPVESPAICSP